MTYVIYPVVFWVDPAKHDSLQAAVRGQWLTFEQALQQQPLSPTARRVLEALRDQEAALEDRYQQAPEAERRPDVRRGLGLLWPTAPAWMASPRDGVARIDQMCRYCEW